MYPSYPFHSCPPFVDKVGIKRRSNFHAYIKVLYPFSARTGLSLLLMLISLSCFPSPSSPSLETVITHDILAIVIEASEIMMMMSADQILYRQSVLSWMMADWNKNDNRVFKEQESNPIWIIQCHKIEQGKVLDTGVWRREVTSMSSGWFLFSLVHLFPDLAKSQNTFLPKSPISSLRWYNQNPI